jgi:hypothetical protein
MHPNTANIDVRNTDILMRPGAVNIVVDNTATMRIVDRNVTRFALAHGVASELITEYKRGRVNITVTLLRDVIIDRRCVYLQGPMLDHTMVNSPPNTDRVFKANLLDRVIQTPVSDLSVSHTLLFTDGENFDAAMRNAFERSLSNRAWPKRNRFTIIVCNNDHGANWLRKFRRIPGVAVVYIDAQTPIPYEYIRYNDNFDLSKASLWTRFRRFFRA